MLRRFVSGAYKRVRVPADVFSFFYVQRVRGFTPPSRPHLDDQTIKWLSNELRATKLFLEFGCGGSTLLADKMAIPTMSVESDPFYAATVRSVLTHPETTQIIALDLGITREWGMPVFFSSKKGMRYASAPFRLLGSQAPDLILIDGRYRVACALRSAAHVVSVGSNSKMLVDDYVGRPAYHILEEFLGAPTMVGRAAIFSTGSRQIPTEAILNYSADPR